MTHNNAHVKA